MDEGGGSLSNHERWVLIVPSPLHMQYTLVKGGGVI